MPRSLPNPPSLDMSGRQFGDQMDVNVNNALEELAAKNRRKRQRSEHTIPPRQPGGNGEELVGCDQKSNELDCLPYVPRIMSHLFNTEEAGQPLHTYMDKQKDINPRMRGILLGWIVEVHQKFKLKPETLYLTFNLIDRFLSKCFVKRNRLQLLGCVCLWIASKYHEIFSPEMNDFVYISDRAFQKPEMLRMEEAVVKFLEFKLTVPTPFVFIQRFIKVAQHNIVTAEQKDTFKQYAFYIMECAILDYRCLRYKPSIIAAGAVYIALQSTGYAAWSKVLSTECRVELDDVYLRHFVGYITKLIEREPHNAVLVKYSKVKSNQVAKIYQVQEHDRKQRQKRVRVF